MANPGDFTATWTVPLSDGVHKVQFEHGTTSGKRVIIVDGVEVFRKNWMFRLVGKESFQVGTKRAFVKIDAIGFVYEYTLNVDGKTLKKFVENRRKTTKTWLPSLAGEHHRVVLEKDTLDVFVDGQPVETAVREIKNSTRRRRARAKLTNLIRANSLTTERKLTLRFKTRTVVVTRA